jgi:hypothetical protein
MHWQLCNISPSPPTAAANASLDDEVTALSAIFGDDFSCEGNTFTVTFRGLSGLAGTTAVQCVLPPSYPSQVRSLAPLHCSRYFVVYSCCPSDTDHRCPE